MAGQLRARRPPGRRGRLTERHVIARCDAKVTFGVQEEATKAIVHERYGSPDVLELRDIDTRVVDDDSVLVRVRAASVNAYDWHMMRGLPFLVRMSEGLRGPKQTAMSVKRT